MCMSFTDLDIDRQEEVLAGIAARSDRMGQFRRNHHTEYMIERYTEMDTADLVARQAHLHERHDALGGADKYVDFMYVADTIQKVLDAREAVGREADAFTQAVTV